MGKQDEEVQRVVGLRYWRSAEAQVVVEAWRRSGEGLGAFADRYGIHPRRLRRWARELEDAAEPVRFHAVRVVHPGEVEHRGEASVEIVLGEGCRVRVPPGFAAEDLERVLEVLGARC
jgi:hypothetical protein